MYSTHLHMDSGGRVFEFSRIDERDLAKEILSLNTSKKVAGDIPTKILKQAVNICAPVLTMCFNNMIDSCIFPDELKLADIVPVHKKGSTLDKANYRPISLLPIVSKLFERLLAKQITTFIEKWLSKFLCGFRKGHSPQHALLNMVRAWQNCLINSGKVGAVLMDLSKAFDCLPHNLLIAKMEAYGFGKGSLKLMLSYLSKRFHRVRISSIFSEWLQILLGVPQGSVLGPILFNLFINDLIFCVLDSSLCNFADDNSLFACEQTVDEVINSLSADLFRVIDWFSSNGMVANSAKFQLIFPGNLSNLCLNVNGIIINSTDTVKLLGVVIDNKLSFYPHVKKLCKSASNKTKALLRVRPFLDQNQSDLLFDSFILSQFNYCLIILMFCSKTAHNLIDHTMCRALMAKQNDFTLQEHEHENIHIRNLRLLLIEVYKSLHCIGPEIQWNTFTIKNTGYNLRRGNLLSVPRVNTKLGINSIDFRAALAWNNLPAAIKSAPNLETFKKEVGSIPIYCRCAKCL